MTLRNVVCNAHRAIERYDPSNDLWAKSLMFDPVEFDRWLEKVLQVRNIPVHPKRSAGRKNTTRERVAAYVAKTYPDGVPAGITVKAIVRDIETEIGLRVSERTVRRALGRA